MKNRPRYTRLMVSPVDAVLELRMDGLLNNPLPE